MSKPLLHEALPDLVNAGIIDDATAGRIAAYFEGKPQSGGNRLMIVFGIIGAMLVGLGIILVVAHNWDSFSKGARLFFAFTPLLIGQFAAAVLIFRKSESVAWKEGTGAFLVLAVGTSISLVSQIYNIHGDLGKFILIWSLLSIPIIYVLNASVGSLMVWIGATSFAVATGYFDEGEQTPWYYLLLAGLLLPHLLRLIRSHPSGNFTSFHHWVVPCSLLISLGGLDQIPSGLNSLNYLGLCGIFVIISQMDRRGAIRWWVNGWAIIGTLGTLSILLTFSFVKDTRSYDWVISPAFIGIVILYLAGFYLLLRSMKWNDMNRATLVFLIFVPVFVVGHEGAQLSRILTNLLILGLSVVVMLDGARKNHLGLLNLGLLILSALIVCRFFDVEISFILRGFIFIIVGIGFFGLNNWMIRRNKNG